MKLIKTIQIAKICHEANKALCETQEDGSQKSWENAPQWQRDSAVSGVKFLVDNPDSSEGILHENWATEKREDGWVYGDIKDPDKKEHPCLVPFDELPPHQQVKDNLFRNIVLALI